MRLLVCGGRDYNNSNLIYNTLCELNAQTRITCIIHGATTGADYEGMIWAQMMATAQPITHAPFIAEWLKYGKSAGPIRNQRMIDEGRPDMVLAFPGGRATADMIQRARKHGIKTLVIKSTP